MDVCERRSYVMIDNGEYILTSEVEFLDIASDIYGNDEMTFKYKGNVYTSNIFSR